MTEANRLKMFAHHMMEIGQSFQRWINICGEKRAELGVVGRSASDFLKNFYL
ncbi:hypothetical protein [Roseibium sp.]|uniref:hypothetical protein n=1 Tax=Roseibium sp. TaxID=1936156 RepID=UPI003B511913